MILPNHKTYLITANLKYVSHMYVKRNENFKLKYNDKKIFITTIEMY